MKKTLRTVAGMGRVLAVLALLVTGMTTAQANSAGISGFSKSPGCAGCHSGGAFMYGVSVVGPTTVTAGATNAYTVQMSRLGGASVAKGGVALTVDAGTLSNPGTGVKILGSDLTHSTPRAPDGSGNVAWTFSWTAPSAAGTSTFSVCANPANGDANISGDGAGVCTTQAITVRAPVDVEPNNDCASAVNLGRLRNHGFVVDGTIGSSTDVDFYSIQTTAGTGVQVNERGAPSGVGTLTDPFVKVFDSACHLVVQNDDHGGKESQARVDVPAGSDGVLLVSAGACCGKTGTYELTIAIAPPAGVRGRILDRAAASPVSGDVELYRCPAADDKICTELVERQTAGSDGQYAFDTVLAAGNYQVRAFSDGFDVGYTPIAALDPSVGFIEYRDLGLVGRSVEITFTGISEQGQADGSTLVSYTYDVLSHAPKRGTVFAFDVVESSDTGSGFGLVRLQDGSGDSPVTTKFRIDPGATVPIARSFVLPASIPVGAQISILAQVSSLTGRFVTVGGQTLQFRHAAAAPGATVTPALTGPAAMGKNADPRLLKRQPD